MNDSLTFCKAIEALAANIWPAEITAYLDNWQLRATRGVTKRANSVLAIGEYPQLANWLPHIEQFYADNSLPAIFHISDASPPGLDALLDSHGYALGTPSLVMIANSQDAAAAAAQKLVKRDVAALTAEWVTEADEEWLDAFLRLESYHEELKESYKGICERISDAKGFVKIRKGKHIIAVGTAVVQGEWAGFLNVVVSEAERGQGLGSYLMQALTAWSREHGAARQYLQVVASNTAAVSLYEKLGYQTKYGYHYRIKYDLRPLATS
ncbi:GNAT family N-acetyltransferase [Paenibacillus planticolens]|uniref:GNAT family N-acetyltransferase n=1 Tax=Paenibacillus planticolens TaxID=2654976 RepID=A0ABX1ZHC2_9BACL|nr:GNAT family N-acetyltransferase [Paenibacillus planticolens]NOU99067.1 GNAT family N-acetyltransferase [Paenibacillus planticolens]